MTCNHCPSKSLSKKGKIGIKQRYQCNACGKYQQDIYSKVFKLALTASKKR